MTLFQSFSEKSKKIFILLEEMPNECKKNQENV